MRTNDLLSPLAPKGEWDAALIEITKNGKNKMPSYKDKLSDDQIKEVVAYVRDLQKKK